MSLVVLSSEVLLLPVADSVCLSFMVTQSSVLHVPQAMMRVCDLVQYFCQYYFRHIMLVPVVILQNGHGLLKCDVTGTSHDFPLGYSFKLMTGLKSIFP